MAIEEHRFQTPERDAPGGSAGARWAGAEEPAALDEADLRIGGYVAIAMFAAGGALLPVIALPIRDMVTPLAVIAIGVVSLACAGVFVGLTRAGRITQDRLYAGDYIWVGLTAGLVAASGGTSSPFFLLYPLPVLHAGAFQSRSRMVVVTVATVLAFLTPLAYDSGRKALFTAMAIIAVPLTVVGAWGLTVALTTLRRQRRELAAAECTALLQARRDPLTGLGNYRMLWSALEAQASRARRHDEQFSVIVLDLDRFKAINDEVGHREGDDALRAVAAALRSGLRVEDICCRHGGDEFAVIAIGAGEASLPAGRPGPRGDARHGPGVSGATPAQLAGARGAVAVPGVPGSGGGLRVFARAGIPAEPSGDRSLIGLAAEALVARAAMA